MQIINVIEVNIGTKESQSEKIFMKVVINLHCLFYVLV